MYYSDYKKKNGSARKDEQRSGYGNQRDNSYYESGDRYSNPNEDRYEQRNTYSGYDVNRSRYNEDDRDRNHNRNDRSFTENYSRGYTSGNAYDRNRDDREDRNVFERAGDRIKEGWNNMTRDRDDDNNRYGSVHSRHNSRQPGFDNGTNRPRRPEDEDYGYHHQRAGNNYAGDNRTYNDGGYDHRRDGYNERRDNRNSFYTSADRDDDYYRGYSEFDRADDRRREDRWRGSFI